MFANPTGRELLIPFAGSDAQDEGNDLGLRRVDLVPVSAEEDVRRKERDTLISVNETMIFDESKQVSRSQIVDRWISVSGFVLRSSQSRLDQTGIPDTRRSTALG